MATESPLALTWLSVGSRGLFVGVCWKTSGETFVSEITACLAHWSLNAQRSCMKKWLLKFLMHIYSTFPIYIYVFWLYWLSLRPRLFLVYLRFLGTVSYHTDPSGGAAGVFTGRPASLPPLWLWVACQNVHPTRWQSITSSDSFQPLSGHKGKNNSVTVKKHTRTALLAHVFSKTPHSRSLLCALNFVWLERAGIM